MCKSQHFKSCICTLAALEWARSSAPALFRAAGGSNVDSKDLGGNIQSQDNEPSIQQELQ